MGLSLVIQPDGEVYRINLNPGRSHLTQMYEHLDCSLVDVVRLDDGLDMWLDDEGMYNHEINPLATLIAHLYGHVHQPYWGPVLICSVDSEGESVDMDDATAAALLERVESVFR
ncbi:DUF3846 domain-containing protein [Nocardia sp. NPDC004260]